MFTLTSMELFFVAAIALDEAIHQLSLGIYIEIAVDLLDVILSSVNRDAHTACDLLPILTEAQEVQDQTLSARKLGRRNTAILRPTLFM